VETVYTIADVLVVWENMDKTLKRKDNLCRAMSWRREEDHNSYILTLADEAKRPLVMVTTRQSEFV